MTEEKEEQEEGAEFEVPKKLKKIVEEIENMKLVDLAELVKILEKKFGVSALSSFPGPAEVSASSQLAQTTPPAEEKKFFNVFLTGVGDKKIEVIKAVRDITQRGLKDSKDMVDKAAEGAQLIKENVKKEEAEEIKKKLEAAGAKVEVK